MATESLSKDFVAGLFFGLGSRIRPSRRPHPELGSGIVFKLPHLARSAKPPELKKARLWGRASTRLDKRAA